MIASRSVSVSEADISDKKIMQNSKAFWLIVTWRLFGIPILTIRTIQTNIH